MTIIAEAAKEEVTNKYQKSGNQELAVNLAQWVLKMRGVLRVGSVTYHIDKNVNPPPAYTILDDVVYSIQIEEFSYGKWKPFKANDVQLEFIRIDPFPTVMSFYRVSITSKYITKANEPTNML